MEDFVPMLQKEKAIEVFIRHRGIIRTTQALDQGINPKTLHSLKKLGLVEPLARGVLHLVDYELPHQLDLIIVSILHPDTIFCLISALDFHNITTQIPKSTQIAVPQGSKCPNIQGHNVQAFYFTKDQLEAGVETHEISGFKIKIFSPEKTVVDCFKYSNKIGLNIAIEALKLCIANKESKIRNFLRYARLARVTKKMQPYLEAIYE